jgi:hypothetical protein
MDRNSSESRLAASRRTLTRYKRKVTKMKKTAFALVVLLCATSLLAGGHECEMNAKAKTVEMTGRIFCKTASDGSCERMFQAAGKDAQPVAICHESKPDFSKLGNDVNVRVKAKMIKCDEDGGKEVLYIESAKKI